MKLSELKNTHRKPQRRKRVGRGTSSNKGKTCCRGHKGAKSRSGYKIRAGAEGGQVPLFKKLPHRGFTNMRFKKLVFEINLDRINEHFEDGETVNRETLLKKGFPVRRANGGIKVLANGVLEKKLVLEANAFSKGAILKLEEKGIEFKRV